MNIENRARRIVIGSFAALLALFAFRAHGQAARAPTPKDVEGPYYPVDWSGELDFDLTTFRGKAYAAGTPLELVGVARNVRGEVLQNARVEIWQADATGKYRHPNDDGEGPALRGFQGFGFATTDSSGRYRFLTIKPAIYTGRPAHIHLRVKAQNYTTLTTQIYFAGENKEGAFGGLFGRFSTERDKLTVAPKVLDAAGATRLHVSFDVVLAAAS